LQRRLTEAPWPPEPVIDRLQASVGARRNTPASIFVRDERGCPKQGRQAVGVARPYCGPLGQVGNCPLGVLLSSVAARGPALGDQRLYLPPAWIDDPARGRAALVPEQMRDQSTAEWGLALLRSARAAGQLHGSGVTGNDA
jgi:SRSO17 transposase